MALYYDLHAQKFGDTAHDPLKVLVVKMVKKVPATTLKAKAAKYGYAVVGLYEGEVLNYTNAPNKYRNKVAGAVVVDLKAALQKLEG